ALDVPQADCDSFSHSPEPMPGGSEDPPLREASIGMTYRLRMEPLQNKTAARSFALEDTRQTAEL
ncbi:MAG TPA: hypothetical protein VKA59_27625, partial [Vicinamibacterales bacterium]|nr:hypothetical protein [Vicinamibacterales bacterium]